MESKEFLKKEKEVKMRFMFYFDGAPHYSEPIAISSTYQLGLTNLKLIDENILEVELRRPGLLIGKGGRDIEKLKKYLDIEIKIKEKLFI